MGLSAKVGNFIIDTSKTSGQTQSITGLGFQPKIVIFWWGGTTSTSDTVAGQDIRAGWGAANGTTYFTASVFALDGATDSDEQCTQYTSRLITIYSSATTLDGYYNACSMDSGGFTLTVGDQYSIAQRITFLALGGTDITNTYISNVTTTGTTGNYNITGVGFQPDVVLIGGYASSVNNTASTGMPLFLGMATASGEQGVVSTYSIDAQATTDARGYGYNGEIIASRGGGERDAFVSFISDGVTLNHISGSSARVVYLVAIKGGQWHVGEFTTRTDTNNISETGVGFQPLAALFASANRTHSTQGTYSDHARLSIGAADGTTQEVQAISNEDNLADTECAVSINDGYVYQHIKDDAQEAAAAWSSFDSDGFTLAQSDAETGACWVTYLAVAANAGTNTSSNRSAYTKGRDNTSSNRSAYTKGSSSASSNRAIYTLGAFGASSNRAVYTVGQSTGTAASSNRSAFVKGGQTSSSNRSVYTSGAGISPALITGFEWGTLSANGSGLVGTIEGSGMSISSSNPQSGSYCLKGDGSGGETDIIFATWDSQPSVVSCSFYFKWHTLCNVETSIIRIYIPTGSTVRINFDPSDQKIFARFVSNGPKVNLVLAQDTWYRIDFKAMVNTGTSYIYYNVNGTGEQSTSYSQSASYFQSSLVGMIESTPTISQGEYYWDSLVFTFDDGDYPLGAHKVAKLSPNNGSSTSNPGTVIKDNGGSTVDDSTNPAYVELDDMPMDSTSDYIEQTGTGTGNYAEVAFESMPAGTPWGVQAYMGYTSSGTTANNGQYRIRDSNGQETTIYNNDMSETSLYYKSKIVSTPSGGWTKAHVDALKGRVGYSNNVATTPRWQSLLLEVAYVETGTESSASRPVYTKGRQDTSSNRSAYTKGKSDTSSNRSVYTIGQQPASSNMAAYAKGVDSSSGNRSVYLVGEYGFSIQWSVLSHPPIGGASASSNRAVYVKGQNSTNSNRSVYTKGGVVTSSHMAIYVSGAGNTISSNRAIYTKGKQDTSSSRSIYTKGKSDITGNRAVYTKGGILSSSNRSAYLHGRADASAHRAIFLTSGSTANSNRAVYTKGRQLTSSHMAIYLFAGTTTSSHRAVYLRTRVYVQSHRAIWVQGYEPSGINKITFTNSNSSLSKNFRILTEGYDDGTYSRQEISMRTIEGKLDRTFSPVFSTWTMVIRVRHTENETGYGTLADLQTFFGYVNPNGTPSNVITFTDHHSNVHSVHMMGPMNKGLIGVQVEGANAWYLYRVVLQEV